MNNTPEIESGLYKPVQQEEDNDETERLILNVDDDLEEEEGSEHYMPIEVSTIQHYGNVIKRSPSMKLILVGCVIFLGTLGNFHRHLQVAVSDAFPGSSNTGFMNFGAANSATGSLFDGEQFRIFLGQPFVPDLESPSPVTLTEKCKKWGVVTTIFDPNEAITRVAKMPTWCLVIVPDTKTPMDYMEKLANLQDNVDGKVSDNVFYFSIEQQKEWDSVEGPFGKFVRSTPWKHFCRKNIGYLFAIMHGAEFIFDFDDDNFVKVDDDGTPWQILPDGDDMASMKLEDTNFVTQGAYAFNHHPMMKSSVDESWARGFPIELIQDKHTRGKVAYEFDLPFKTESKEIGVIQFLADGNPDIDAMHRLSKPLPMTFPVEDAKSVLVPTHAYAPYNAQATIHTHNAFWAMLLPGTVPGRISDIWRSYFAQCIFADTGLQLVFSPPKIYQERNEHNYLGDFDAEQDLYAKSGKLIEYLSKWDCERCDTVPKRMEQLWIDLYERGYIEINDVYAVQMWLGALTQSGYKFPALKRRFRNVAVMGQFNYATRPPTILDDVIFWAQKQREKFATVVAAGPFSYEQINILEANSISVRKSNQADRGFYTPLLNHMNLVREFEDSDTIEGVLYMHDDGILNVTELTQGQYPFPSQDIIASDETPNQLAYRDVRKEGNLELANKLTYRIFPDGHLEDFSKTRSFPDIEDMYQNSPLKEMGWIMTMDAPCGGGQTQMAMDEASADYREEDGSLLLSSHTQSDFLYMPTKYSSEFNKAGALHLKHNIWIECSYGTIVDMIRRKTDAQVRITSLCTDWDLARRGSDASMKICMDDETNHGFMHPYKIAPHGYKAYGDMMESMQ